MTSKAERRAIRDRLRDDEARGRALTTPRDPARDISYAGFGARLCQILWRPSLIPPVAFDIRTKIVGADVVVAPVDEEGRVNLLVSAPGIGRLELYRAEGVAADERMVVGYQRVDVAEAQLASFLAELATMTVPLTCSLSSSGVADGVHWELAVEVDFRCGIRVAWMDGSALSGLRDVTRLVESQFEAFSVLPTVSPAAT
jgi:hypothetical protein